MESAQNERKTVFISTVTSIGHLAAQIKAFFSSTFQMWSRCRKQYATASHVICVNQLKCLISAYLNYATLKFVFVYDIGTLETIRNGFCFPSLVVS